MNLISKSKVNTQVIEYYDGIDLNVISKHPSQQYKLVQIHKHGGSKVLVCFIKNWKAAVRDNKIDSILSKTDIVNINDINNSNVIIYQADNVPILDLYDVIKEKLENGFLDSKPWLPVAGIDKGGWKIGNINTKT